MNSKPFIPTTTITLCLSAWLIALLCSANLAIADTANTVNQSAIEQNIRKALPNTNITSIDPAPINGLVEVVDGSNVLYADPTGRYLLVGSLYDMNTATDLTAERKARLHTIPWSSLPMETVIKHGKPGTPKVAIFYDPDCTWCRKLHQQLSEQQEVEVYTVLYPVEGLHPDAKQKSAEILCHPNPKEALNFVTQGKPLSSKSDQACITKAMKSLEGVMTFARENGIQGTPTLIAEDGRVRAGYMPFDQIKSWLNSSSKGASQ